MTDSFLAWQVNLTPNVGPADNLILEHVLFSYPQKMEHQNFRVSLQVVGVSVLCRKPKSFQRVRM